MVNANNVDRALMRFEFLQVCLSIQPHPNPNPNPCPNPSPKPHPRPAPNLTPTPLGPDACRHRVLPIYHPYYVCTQRQPKPPPQTSSHPQHQPQLQPYTYRPWYVWPSPRSSRPLVSLRRVISPRPSNGCCSTTWLSRCPPFITNLSLNLSLSFSFNFNPSLSPQFFLFFLIIFCL